MGIDIAVAIILLLCFFKGYSEGIIMSFFSVVSYLIGFLAAIHFSFIIADYLSVHLKISEQWIPIISFIFLFITVIIIVRWLGKMIEKLVGQILPSIMNKFAGGVLWILIGIILFSLLFQVLDKTGIFTANLKEESFTLPYLTSINKTIRLQIGDFIPFIQNLYQRIDDYFKVIANQIST